MRQIRSLLFGATALLFAALPAVTPVSAQEPGVLSQAEAFAGDYVGTMTAWMSLSGLGTDGSVARQHSSGSGPVSMTLHATGGGSGTWEVDADTVAVYSQDGAEIHVDGSTHTEGRLEAIEPFSMMSGTQTGSSTVSIDSTAGAFVQSVQIGPEAFGPFPLTADFVDCNQLWLSFSPPIDDLAADVGWERRDITGTVMIVPANPDTGELSLQVQGMNVIVRKAIADLWAWSSSAQAAAAAGEQPDIRGAQEPVEALEQMNSQLDTVSRCDPGREKDQALWRSQVSDAIRDELNAILGHSPADVTFTSSTLNDMATVGARAAALGEGATDTSGGLTGNLQSAARDSANAGRDSAGLARLNARIGSGS